MAVLKILLKFNNNEYLDTYKFVEGNMNDDINLQFKNSNPCYLFLINLCELKKFYIFFVCMFKYLKL